jgi:uncharacterized protein DUF6412
MTDSRAYTRTMVWFSALWHLLGALPALADLGPATLVAAVTVAVLAVALAVVGARLGDTAVRGVGPAGGQHIRAALVVRSTDPNAPGRPRPRAPSR